MSGSPQQPAIDLASLSPSLQGVCDGYLHSYRQELEDATRQGQGGLSVARRHAEILDGLLGALYCASDAEARKRGLVPEGRVALIGVGGYGRGLVALHSDVDVLFLCDEPNDVHVRALAEGVLYPLWDMGLQIGHAVRGIEETLQLAREDIRTATTLIDLRRLAGDEGIVCDLDRRGRQQVFEPALEVFLDALEKDTHERHERFGGSLYLLEPEVKLGRGGLRDLDVAEWAARARWGRESDLVRTGALLGREVAELDVARELLWRVRNLLHLRAGRQHDRLTFADQEEIATELGFVDGVTLAVEQFMQAYYRHARIVAQTAERMLVRARPTKRRAPASRRDLRDGTMVFDEQVTLGKTESLQKDPAVALRLYWHVARLRLPPYAFARDAIARTDVDTEWCERLRASTEASACFMQLLTHVGDVPVRRGSLLGELHEVGLLTAMIPEFEPITGRVLHDVYHVYTVDVHTVASVDRLRALMRGELATSLPLPCQIAAEQPRPQPLFLALLLHDLGKGRGREPARMAAELARPIGDRLGLSEFDLDHVSWLVAEQGSLYHWATRRDTSDPAILEEVARRVGTVERLRDLYLITVACVSTINPTAMSSWKARMLEDLYLGVAAVLEGESPTSTETRADQIREEVRVGFVGDAGQQELEAFLRQMPDRYLLAHPVDVVRYHARAARDRGDAPLRVKLGPGPSREVSELLVITDDRPGLLADVAAVLAANRLAVMGAQIYTRKRPGKPDEVFDVFQVRRDSRREEPVDEEVRRRVERDIIDLLDGRVTAEDLMARIPSTPSWARRRSPEVPTEVTVDNDASARFTVVDVYTRDQVGLLHVIARTLHEQELSIALSRVNTEGLRVADVFYVEDAASASGGKVSDPERLSGLQAALREAVEELHQSADANTEAGPS